MKHLLSASTRTRSATSTARTQKIRTKKFQSTEQQEEAMFNTVLKVSVAWISSLTILIFTCSRSRCQMTRVTKFCCPYWRAVCITLEKFENGRVSLWKRIRRFPSVLHRIKLITPRQSPVILDLYLSKTPAGKSDDYPDVVCFEKAPFLKCFPSTLKL